MSRAGCAALGVIAAAATLALGGPAGAGPSEVVFPPQRIPLRFSHRTHLAKHLACDFCHEQAPVSRAATDSLVPTEEVCATCHEIDRAHPERSDRAVTPCATCHVGAAPGRPIARVEIPPPQLRFDHKAHADRGVACVRCHGALDDVDLATRAQLPRMAVCLECHDNRRAKLHAGARCATCHPANPDGTLATQLPSGVLVPSGQLRGDAHTSAFRARHAEVARNDERYCLSCHRRDECLSCHNGVVKPWDLHGNDYVHRHAVQARRNDPDCSACHRAQSFCLACHERLGVVDVRSGHSAFAPASGRTFHPQGWSDPRAGSQPNHHAWQAQRNIRQCASCHRQETCLDCHASATGAGATGKMQVNPHPLDWRGSDRCRALADRNLRVCLRCHGARDPHLSCQ